MSWKKHSFSSSPSFGILCTHWHTPTLVSIASSHSWVLLTFTTSPLLYLFVPRNSSYHPQPTPMVATYSPSSFILHGSWLYLTMKWRQAAPLLQCSSCGVIECMLFQTRHYDITQRKEEMRRSVTGSYQLSLLKREHHDTDHDSRPDPYPCDTIRLQVYQNA